MFEEHILLDGLLKDKREAELASVPVGLRDSTPRAHGHETTVVSLGRGNGHFLPVPDLQSQLKDVTLEGGRLQVRSNSQLRHKNSRSGAIKGASGGIRYDVVSSDSVDTVRDEVLFIFNPLVAVVDEPGIDRDFFLKKLKSYLLKMKPVGREPKLASRWLQGDKNGSAAMAKLMGGEREYAIRARIEGALNSYERVKAENGGRMPEYAKGKAYGGIDPYHMTYQASIIGALSHLAESPAERERYLEYGYVLAKSIAEVAGKKASLGRPTSIAFIKL